MDKGEWLIPHHLSDKIYPHVPLQKLIDTYLASGTKQTNVAAMIIGITATHEQT